MRRNELPAGHVLFRKGEVGAEAFLIGSGEVHIPEYDALVRPGDLLGEIGLLATDNLRSATAVCRTPVRAWRVSYQELIELLIADGPAISRRQSGGRDGWFRSAARVLERAAPHERVICGNVDFARADQKRFRQATSPLRTALQGRQFDPVHERLQRSFFRPRRSFPPPLRNRG